MEITLLEKAIRGNKRSLRHLLKNESEFIYKLALLHTKDEGDARIILRQTVTYIYNHIHKLSRNKNLDIYITKITIMHINKYLSDIGIIENDEVKILNQDGKIDFYNAIDILDNYSKNTMILKYYYNMSFEDIGRVLDINEGTLKLYVRKSLKIMKEYYKEELLYERKA